MHYGKLSDETLKAYVDGTLDSETEHLVERAMKIDPVIGQRVVAFAEAQKAVAALQTLR